MKTLEEHKKEIAFQELVAQVKQLEEKIKKLKKEDEKEIAFKELTDQVKQGLSLPETATFSPYAYKADIRVGLKAETLQDALVTAEKMNPEAMARYKDSCLTFIPEERIEEEDLKYVTDVCAWVYEVSQLRGYQTEYKLKFFVKHESIMVAVHIQVKTDPDTDIEAKFKHSVSYGQPYTRKEYCRLINNSGHFAHYDQMWASEDQPNSFYLY